MLHLHIFWIKQCRSLFYVILCILTLLRGNVFIPPFVFTHMFNFSGALRFSVYICVCVQVAVWCHFLSTWRVPLVFLARKICWWWILLVFLYLGISLFCLQFQGMVLLDLVFLVDGTAEREVFVVPLQSSWTPCDHEAAGVHGQPTWTNRYASHAVGRAWEGGKGPDSHSF